jgi:hypothetical protein
MRGAVVVFSIILALICVYWTYAYIRRRAGFGRRRRRWRP